MNTSTLSGTNLANLNYLARYVDNKVVLTEPSTNDAVYLDEGPDCE